MKNKLKDHADFQKGYGLKIGRNKRAYVGKYKRKEDNAECYLIITKNLVGYKDICTQKFHVTKETFRTIISMWAVLEEGVDPKKIAGTKIDVQFIENES